MCKKEKSVVDFSKNKNKKDGLNGHCKKCHSNYRKNRYKENPEREKISNFNYRQNNYVNSNCCVCNKDIVRYRTNVGEGKNNYCKECLKFSRRYKNISPVSYYIRSSKRRSKNNKFKFNLKEKYLEKLFIKQGGKCKVTNIPIELHGCYTKKGTLATTASLDRIDNSKGYIKGNVRFVSLGVNYMKNRRSDEELFELLSLIKENYNIT